MIVGDKVIGFALILEADSREHGSKVVAEMQRAAGLNAGENSHGGSGWQLEPFREGNYDRKARHCQVESLPF